MKIFVHHESEPGGNSVTIEPNGIFVFADANTSNHESEIVESND